MVPRINVHHVLIHTTVGVICNLKAPSTTLIAASEFNRRAFISRRTSRRCSTISVDCHSLVMPSILRSLNPSGPDQPFNSLSHQTEPTSHCPRFEIGRDALSTRHLALKEDFTKAVEQLARQVSVRLARNTVDLFRCSDLRESAGERSRRADRRRRRGEACLVRRADHEAESRQKTAPEREHGRARYIFRAQGANPQHEALPPRNRGHDCERTETSH